MEDVGVWNCDSLTSEGVLLPWRGAIEERATGEGVRLHFGDG